MNKEIKADFIRDENRKIKTSIHQDRYFTKEGAEPVEVETLFAEIKIAVNNSEDKILKVRIDGAQLNDEEYQKKFLQDIIYNQSLGWLDL